MSQDQYQHNLNMNISIKSKKQHNELYKKLTLNNNFLEEVAKTNIYQKIDNHIKTPLHQEVLRQKLEEEQWEKGTKTFYEKNLDLYADIFLINEENRNMINDQIKNYEEK